MSVLIGVAVFVCLWRFGRGTAVVSAPTPSPEPEQRLPTALPGPRTARPVPCAPREEIAPACRKAWDGLRGLDVRELRTTPLPDLSACASLPKPFDALQQAYLKACRNLNALADRASREQWNEAKWDEVSAPCLTKLLAYRGAVVAWSTKGMALKEISDPRVLADKLIAEANGNPAAAAATADRLVELDEKSYPAAKASAVGHFQELMGSTDPHDPRWGTWLERLERARALAPRAEAAELAEMEVIARLRRSENDEAESVAESVLRSGDETTGYYLLAGVAYKSGKPELARQYLRRAAAAEKGRAQPEGAASPKLARILETARRLDAHEEPVFTYGFGFGMPLAPEAPAG